MLDVGDVAPDFVLKDQDGNVHRKADYAGQRFVVFFYPRDNTLFCTQEVCAFQEDLGLFRDVGVPVLGVSADGIGSHKAFAKRHGLDFPLLSDRERTMIRGYGADGLLGRTKRITYLIGADGRVEAVHRQELSGRGHAAWAKQAVQAIA